MSFKKGICMLGLLPSLALFSVPAKAAVVPLAQPGMAVEVQAGKYTALGQTIKVAKPVVLTVAAPDRLSTKSEEVTISDENPGTYAGGTVLSRTRGTMDYSRVPWHIDPDSVKVHSTADGGTVYTEGTDYFVEHQWGGISRIATGTIAKDAKVYVDYDVHLQRIDIVQATKDGTVTIKKGEPKQVCPEVPVADKGCVVLANIYLPFRTTAITAEDIMPMPAKNIDWHAYIKTSGREYLKNTLAKLKAGKPVTVICWGDSVTAGGSPSSHDKCYVEVLRSRLTDTYKSSKITLINAGIGGTSSWARMDGFQKEVLDYNPDLITVEYVNDTWMKGDDVKANYLKFMAIAREKNPNVEFIIITPHHMIPGWMPVFQDSVRGMREAAVESKAAIADATYVWDNLPKVGIPTFTLEANGINHPNDLGHEIFAASLMQLLAPSK